MKQKFTKSIIFLSAIFLGFISFLNAEITGGAAEEGAEYIMSIETPDVISASNKIEKIDEAPANIFVLTETEILQRGYTTLFDIISNLPGVTWENAVGNERNGVTIVRGMLYQKKLKTLLNGMVIDDKGGSGYGWAKRLPVEGIERVEFIIGPYASFYGRNSFAGVINIITKSGEKLNGSVISALYGEWNQYQGVAVFGKKINVWDIYLSAMKNHSTEGEDLTKTYPDQYKKENRDGHYSPVLEDILHFADGVSGDWFHPWDNSDVYIKIKHDCGLQFEVDWNKIKWPSQGAFLTPLYYVQPKESKVVEQYKNYKIQYNFDFESWTTSTAINRQEYNFDQKTIDYFNGLHRIYIGSDISNQIEEKIRINFNEKNSLYIGASYETLDLLPQVASSKTNPPQKPTITKNMYLDLNYLNLSIQDEIKFLEKFKVVTGLMYEKSNAYDDVFLPRFSFLYDVSDNTILKLLYGTGYIVPDPMVIGDQLIGGSNDLMGTTSLKPEKVTTYDINLVHTFYDKVRLSASVYLNKIENVIALSPDSTLPPPYDLIYKNLGRQETKGFELNLEAGLTNYIKMFSIWSNVNGSYDNINEDATITKTNRLPLSAPNHIKTGFDFLLLENKLNLNIYDLYISKIETWTSENLDGYNLVNLSISTTPGFNNTWAFSLRITNLFDKKAFDAPIMNGSIYPKAPIESRSWTVRVTSKF